MKDNSRQKDEHVQISEGKGVHNTLINKGSKKTYTCQHDLGKVMKNRPRMYSAAYQLYLVNPKLTMLDLILMGMRGLQIRQGNV